MSDPLEVLAGLVAQPTTSFHEEQPARFVQESLNEAGLAAERDAYGNILCHYQRGKAALPVALVAHLDHPGLEIVQGGARRARAVLFGGVDPACFTQPVPVRLFAENGEVKGAIVGCRPAGPEIELDLEIPGPVTPGDFGVFDLPDFVRNGNTLSMRVADDLAGCAATLAVLARLASEERDGDVWGIFTRAEEVGLIGATLIARERRLPLETLMISIECSRELPGAHQGHGAVIRVGDARSTFHPEAEGLLIHAREWLARRAPEISIQRQLMSGGTCEATAFGVFGYRSTGLAFPLQNYHNVGDDQMIRPEIIDARDFLGGVELLLEATQVALSPPPPPRLEVLSQLADRHASRLRESSSR